MLVQWKVSYQNILHFFGFIFRIFWRALITTVQSQIFPKKIRNIFVILLYPYQSCRLPFYFLVLFQCPYTNQTLYLKGNDTKLMGKVLIPKYEEMKKYQNIKCELIMNVNLLSTRKSRTKNARGFNMTRMRGHLLERP